MAYNSNKGPQHEGDIQYEGDPNDTQIDFENDTIALKTNAQQRFVVTGSAITGSTYRFVFKPEELPDAFRITVGSTNNSDNIFRIDTDSGYFHTTTGYKWRIGSDTAAPSHALTVTGDISGSGEIQVVGDAFIGGNLNVSGSTTYTGTTAFTNISASGTVHADGATTIGNTLTTTGSITAGTTVTAGTGLLGNTLDINSSALVITAAGNLSGSGTVTCTSISASADVIVSGNVGIGTTAPGYDLHVNGAGVTIATIDGGSGADAYLRFNTNGVEKAYIKQGSGGNTIITNDVAGKNLQLQARPVAGAAATYLFLDGGSESILMAKPVSASSTLHQVGASTFGSTIATTGSITAGTSFVIGSADLNETDLEKLDGITDGVGASNKALVLDGTNDITSGLNSLKATYLTSSIYSGSMLLHNVGAATFGTTIAASGSVTAVGLYSTELISGSLGMHVDSPVTFGSTLNVTGNILTPSNIKSTAGYISASLQVKAQKLVINGITRIAANGDVDASMLSASHGMHVDQDATFGANVAITSSLGVGIAPPVTALDVHHNPTTLSNDTGGGEVVKFGTGTLTTGKMYYLHSGSSWQQTDMILAESGGVGLLGIAVGSSPTSNGLLVRGFFDVHTYLSGVFTVGQPVYVSAPGYLTTMRPSGSAEIVRQVGYCTTTANVVYFNPSSEYIELV